MCLRGFLECIKLWWRTEDNIYMHISARAQWWRNRLVQNMTSLNLRHGDSRISFAKTKLALHFGAERLSRGTWWPLQPERWYGRLLHRVIVNLGRSELLNLLTWSVRLCKMSGYGLETNDRGFTSNNSSDRSFWNEPDANIDMMDGTRKFGTNRNARQLTKTWVSNFQFNIYLVKIL
jgi:hypothetical protein